MTKFLSLLAALVISTSAMATDLPSYKNAPLPPVNPYAFVVEPTFYAGAFAGAGFPNSVFGGLAGVNVTKNIAAEATYTYVNPVVGDKYRHEASANILPNINVTDRLKAYAIGGIGYAWANDSVNRPTWTAGAGLRYALTQNVALDARYTHVDSFNGNVYTNDRATAGVLVGF